jgi:hypothetical protein
MRRSGSLLPRAGLALLVLAPILLAAAAWWLISPTAGLVAATVLALGIVIAASVLVLPARLVARDINGVALEG